MSPRGESAATTASAPGTTSPATSETSSCTYRTPSTGSCAAVLLTATTSWPRAAASRTTLPPTYPVPPKTTILAMDLPSLVQPLWRIADETASGDGRLLGPQDG